jgi:F0F1-type ATP synthase epsilon subunit
MRAKILSLKGTEFEGEIVSLNIKTTSGEITVLDHHLPLLTVLTKGNAVITMPDGSKKNLAIISGFLEVGKGNTLSALVG